MPRKQDIIYEHLKNAIVNQSFADGRIPNERELAIQLQVSQRTLRAALSRLEEEDLIERIRSRGTFIKTTSVSSGKRNFLCIMNNRPSVENPFIYVLPGIEFEAKRNGYHIVIMDYEQVHGMSGSEFNRLFSSRDFAGILLCVHQSEIHEQSPWAESPLPVVVSYSFDEYRFPPNTGGVHINSRECWRMALMHLLECGHRRIGCITSVNWNTLRGMPFKEYLHLLKVNGADTNPELIVQTHYDKVEINQAISKLLDMRRPPTALLCFSDFFAIYACDAIKRRNWNIPDDIAVMGNCGYPGAEFFEVPLSTVSYNYYDCGVSAVRLLLETERWTGKQTAPHVVMSPTLIERTSTAIHRVEIQTSQS